MRSAIAPPLVSALVVSVTAIASLLALEPKDSDFVDIQAVNPNILVDLPYATKKNFCGEKLYPIERCFFRRRVAQQLDQAQQDLEKQGLGLKIWDGYRPRSVQYRMWEVTPKKGYVANPTRGSRHNRGAAVDVTLVDSDGKELEMPTEYDHFSFKANAYYAKASAVALKNRKILQRAMTANGFAIMKTEWWHFDAIGWRDFPLADDSLPDLAAQHDAP